MTEEKLEKNIEEDKEGQKDIKKSITINGSNYERRRKWLDGCTVLFCVLMVHFVIAAMTGKWPWQGNPYNSYALQSVSWLEGRLDLGQNYEWLELAIFQGKYFVSFPPFPSYILLPFAAFMGVNTPDGWIALVCTLIGALYALKICWHFIGVNKRAVFWSLFLYVGTNIIYITNDGWVWFIAQNMSLMFSLMSIYYACRKKGGWSLAFWACAVGCRPMQILYLPILLYLLYKGLKEENVKDSLWDMIKKKWFWAIPTGLIALSYMILNYARFGKITEFGHNYLPEFTREEAGQLGQFNIGYIAENIKTLFRLPEINDQQIITFFSSNGNAIWIVSPIFLSFAIYFIWTLIKKKRMDGFLYWCIPLLVVVHFVLLTAHRTMGGYHFGNRYPNDTLPFLFLGLCLMMQGKRKHNTISGEEVIDRFSYVLFFMGILFNIIGTVAYSNQWL